MYRVFEFGGRYRQCLGSAFTHHQPAFFYLVIGEAILDGFEPKLDRRRADTPDPVPAIFDGAHPLHRRSYGYGY